MLQDLTSLLLPLLVLPAQASAYPDSLLAPLAEPETRGGPRLSVGKRQTNSSGSSNSTNVTPTPTESDFLWIIQDTYDATNFFQEFHFFNFSDPTHGTVTYVDHDTAFAHNLSYISSDGKIVMKGDDTNWLAQGEYRESVRVSSNTIYNGGLFILDTDRAPWGCGVWPAFWTVGEANWPEGGEIDIIEGVHDNEHNQVTWHTNPGCNLTKSANFTGSIVGSPSPNLDCTGSATKPGCGITEWSQASYGPTFDAVGGGVFAMKWDEDGIAVWSFYRVAVPQDIQDGTPNPANWPTPVAALAPNNCNPAKYFANHSIVFDITFCGDWAGNSYATSGCPGTCSDRLMDPGNFVNASWNINWLKVYRRQTVKGVVSSAAGLHTHTETRSSVLLALAAASFIIPGWLAVI
ncbi:glycoside hydrolase family 16 protein [Auriscalpium vulgare]|uniref:Glycoside hydrolase family 16 protein n=1 Tax=Auriscalpium vulgare TaxID=40419 RepID=A0ACB8S6Z7_9AGAM|nr:glycoside hydrolase family 16 protein [Auriscalpium vulgare]